MALLLPCSLYGQSWQQSLKKADSTFYDIRRAFYNYVEQSDSVHPSTIKQFKRWESFMKPRVYPTGKPFIPDILWTEFKSYKKMHSPLFTGLKGKTGNEGQWQLLGPIYIPGNGGGAGRVNAIVINPQNPSSIWVGTPDGGLWNTVDGGNTWNTNTDFLPNLGVTDIVINPVDTTVMYIATGDGYGLSGIDALWGGTYSMGVLKSTDGGTTWNSTGLNWNITQSRQIHRLALHPADTGILLVSTSNGIWKSYDGANNWVQKTSGIFYDIKFNAGNYSIVYATSDGSVYRSVNSGDTWAVTGGPWPGVDAIALSVTPANPDVVYAYCDDNLSFYRSSDGGINWVIKTFPDVYYSYGWYTPALAVSAINENIVFAGGIDIAKSIDGGNTWTAISDWYGWPASNYAHADHRALVFHPTNSSIIYTGNDGGIFKSTNSGITWTDLSDRLSILQIYRLGASANDSSLVYVGAQDNGINRYDNGNWTMQMLTDGMECIVDYNNNNIIYGAAQNGWLYKSTDGGINFTDITPPGATGAWTTPFIIHPANPQILYYGELDVYKTTDGGMSWFTISTGLAGSEIIAMALSPSDPNFIYVSKGEAFYGSTPYLFKTSNGGSTWQNIGSGLPFSIVYPTALAVHPYNPQSIWVSFSGFVNSEKVYHSDNGGSSWYNISGSLPNIPVNTIVYDHSDTAENSLYIGTDFGVFYRNDTLVDWLPYMNNLPNVIINELEIHYPSRKIRAATYGRGLWEAPLYYAPQTPPCLQPVADFTYTVSGMAVSFSNLSSSDTSWSWDFGDGNTSTAENPIHSYNDSGTYNICLTAGNTCGNNTICKQITISAPPCLSPTASFYYEASGLTVIFYNTSINDSAWLWEMGDGTFTYSKNPVYIYPNNGNYEVCLTAFNPCGTDTFCGFIYFADTSTVIANLAMENKIAIFPNPTNRYVQIKTHFPAKTELSLSIYTSAGHLVRSFQLQPEPDALLTIDISAFFDGVYLFRFQTPDGWLITKVPIYR